jgi:hypothetical protein
MAETITVAFWMVLCVNAMLFMGQIAIIGVNPSGMTYINSEGNIIGILDQGNGTYILNDGNSIDNLPSGATTVDPETNLQYTDSFTGIKGFFLETLGLGYVGMILSAPYNFVKSLGVPQAFSFIIGSLWYAFTLFLLLGYLFGRST